MHTLIPKNVCLCFGIFNVIIQGSALCSNVCTVCALVCFNIFYFCIAASTVGSSYFFCAADHRRLRHKYAMPVRMHACRHALVLERNYSYPVLYNRVKSHACDVMPFQEGMEGAINRRARRAWSASTFSLSRIAQRRSHRGAWGDLSITSRQFHWPSLICMW